MSLMKLALASVLLLHYMDGFPTMGVGKDETRMEHLLHCFLDATLAANVRYITKSTASTPYALQMSPNTVSMYLPSHLNVVAGSNVVLIETNAPASFKHLTNLCISGEN